jgi:hypothetical protein
MAKVLTLDERIAQTLSSPPAASAPIFELLVEVSAAIETLDEEARVAREQSVNPAHLDGEALREKSDVATFRANRYHNGLVGLQDLYNKAVAVEQDAVWRAEFDKVRVIRDQLAAEFSSRYVAIVEELTTLFNTIIRCDRDVTRINTTAPESESMRLRKVEAAARDVDAVQGDSSIIDSCRLPNLTRYGVTMAWPPAETLTSLQVLAGFLRNGTPDASEDEHYETVFDESTGFYVARRRADAPPLFLPAAPPQMTMREQALAEQAARAEERERLASEGARRSC